MIKTIPLMEANLKGFVRNWRSVFLLIIVPLILISVIFLAFNPIGIQKTRIGLVSHTDKLSVDELKPYVQSFLIMKEFQTIDDCFVDLKRYNQYVCLEAYENKSIILNLYFDNTRTPVIWEILARLKGTIEYLQKDKTKQIAEEFLGEFGSTRDRIDNYKRDLNETHQKIEFYLEEVEATIEKLEGAQINLQDKLTEMDDTIEKVDNVKDIVKSENDYMFNYVDDKLGDIENTADDAPTSENYELNSDINSIESDARSSQTRLRSFYSYTNTLMDDIDDRIDEFKEESSQGRQFMTNINTHLNNLDILKEDLELYKDKIQLAILEIEAIEQDFLAVQGVDAETIANPIVLANYPVYVPEVDNDIVERFSKDEEETQIEKVVRGFSMINLQTIFPMLLMLITIFLSLLVSSFLCLSEINSKAYQRIGLIPKSFLPEFLAVYLSSLIIIMIPILCVMLLGNFMFVINILGNFAIISLLMFLTMSVFILFGMGLAYLIKKESTTLLISTFVLVFLMFFSGFLMPIERMTTTAAAIANHFPGSLAMSAFSKAVFYQQGLSTVFSELNQLLVWFWMMIIVVLVIKKVRNT